jgi:hypothetical protein
MEQKKQTIISLRAENCKRLSAVEIHADGRPTIIVGGRNAQGKSSVLDALAWAFAGKGSLPDQPIRQGAERATILARTQDYVIERRITPSGSTVTVRAADGSRLTSPQKVLDQLISDIAFDPLAFLRAPPKKQAEALARVADIDLEAHAAQRREIYEQRTAVNRQAKDLEAQVRPVAADAPQAETSISDMLLAVEEAQDQQRRRQAVVAVIESKRERVAALEAQIKQLQVEWCAATERIEIEERRLAEMPEPQDVGPLRERLSDAERLNRLARERHAQDEILANLDRARARSEKLTQRLADMDAGQARALAEARLPVDGLAFDGEGLSLHGVPLSQASSAEQLRVSVALALAQSPGLRVAIIRDGSLLDRESLAMVAAMAQDAGAQVWIERVGDGEEVSVVIEDGRVSDDRLGTPCETRDSEPQPEDSSDDEQQPIDAEDIDGVDLF